MQFNKPSFIILYRIHLPEVERCLQKFVTVPVRERGFRIHFCSSDQVLGFRSLGYYQGYPLTLINKKANYTTKTQTLFNHVKHMPIHRSIYKAHHLFPGCFQYGPCGCCWLSKGFHTPDILGSCLHGGFQNRGYLTCWDFLFLQIILLNRLDKQM